MKIHHVGYLVKSIKKAVEDFKLLGYKEYGSVTYDPIRDIDILLYFFAFCNSSFNSSKNKPTSLPVFILFVAGNQ